MRLDHQRIQYNATMDLQGTLWQFGLRVRGVTRNTIHRWPQLLGIAPIDLQA